LSQDDEAGFLGRWARRKAQIQAQEKAQEKAHEKAQDEGGEAGAEVASGGPAEEPFDLASLPKLEEIDAATDVSVFLRREVPDWLRNAALKKAWAADPAIRDYVNPAMEYAFDWNAPGGVPGSGALEAGYDAARQALDMLSHPPAERIQNPHTFVHRSSPESAESPENEALDPLAKEPQALRLSSADKPAPDENNNDNSNASETPDEAPRASAPIEGAAPRAPRRRHGGAAPA
jgi:hypothetical protein